MADEIEYLSHYNESKREIAAKTKGKIKINGKLIGKGITIANKQNVDYKDAKGNKYNKDQKGNLHILYSAGELVKTLYLPGFQEGDYGLWIEKEAPYYLDGDTVVKRATGEKAKQSKVLNEEDNEWLNQEERIKDDFLWIHRGEEIIFPEEEEKDQAKQSQDNTENNAVSQRSSQAQNKNDKQEKNQQQASNSTGSQGGGGRLYVCDGATLQCNQGDKKSKLKVPDEHQVYIGDKPMATIKNNKPLANIKPFGKCKSMANPTVAQATAANHGNLKPMPCQPNIAGPWQGGKDDVTIANIPTLLETSKLNCAYAGVIKIVDPGQDFVLE